MNILRFLERLVPERRALKLPRPAVDTIAAQLHREIQPLGDSPVLRLLDTAQASMPPRSEAETRALVDTLARLPRRQRHVLELLHNGYSPAEIAQALGVTNRVACKEIAAAMGVMRREGMKRE